MKYTDYSLGVGLGPRTGCRAAGPAAIDLQSLILDVAISEAKKDEVENALRRAVAAVTR